MLLPICPSAPVSLNRRIRILSKKSFQHYKIWRVWSRNGKLVRHIDGRDVGFELFTCCCIWSIFIHSGLRRWQTLTLSVLRSCHFVIFYFLWFFFFFTLKLRSNLIIIFNLVMELKLMSSFNKPYVQKLIVIKKSPHFIKCQIYISIINWPYNISFFITFYIKKLYKKIVQQ